MAYYQTGQKRMLLAFLRAHSESSFTIEEIVEGIQRMAVEQMDMAAESPQQEVSGRRGSTCEGVRSQPTIPGKSTVYRLIPKLVEEGLVKRFVKGTSRHFVYQMVCGEHCDCHMHMKCMVCGQLFHMEDQESRRMMEQIRQIYHFSVDSGKTVFLGQCEHCSARPEQKADEGLQREAGEECGQMGGLAWHS